MRCKPYDEWLDVAAIAIAILRITAIRHVNVRQVYREVALKFTQESQSRLNRKASSRNCKVDRAVNLASKPGAPLHRRLFSAPQKIETPSVQRSLEFSRIKRAIHRLEIVILLRAPFRRCFQKGHQEQAAAVA